MVEKGRKKYSKFADLKNVEMVAGLDPGQA
jgi:hypothetical protein